MLRTTVRMGLVYVPQSIGKGATSGNFRFSKPIFPRFGGRFGGVIQGAATIGQFLWKNRRLYQGAAIVATGAGLSAGSTGLDLVGSSDNQFGQALRSTSTVRRSRRKQKSIKSCHCKQLTRISYRRKSRRYR